MWNHSHQTFHTLQPNSRPIGSGQIMKASYTSVTKLEIWSCCIVQIQSRNNQKTRWYPWGIQQLVSTHQLPHKSGGYSRPTQIQSAKICPNFHFGVGWWAYSRATQIQSDNICSNCNFWRGDNGKGCTPDQLKSKVPRSGQIFIGGWGWWGGVLQTNIPEILKWGHSRNFEPKILATGMFSASQIVSHILRMWRLIN